MYYPQPYNLVPTQRAKEFFVPSSGVITDEAIIEYIRTQDVTNADGDLRVEGE
jgi:hypothetical protein